MKLQNFNKYSFISPEDLKALADAILTVNKSIVALDKVISHLRINELVLGITTLDKTVDALSKSFESCRVKVNETDDELTQYKDTINAVEEAITKGLLKAMDDFAVSMGISHGLIIDIVGVLSSLFGILYSIGTFLAVLETLFTGSFTKIMGGAAAMGRAFVAAFGPASAAVGAVMFILGLVEHTAMILSDISLWQRRVENKTPTISSTQPGQDNLKYVKYSDEVNIVPFEQSVVKIDVEQEGPPELNYQEVLKNNGISFGATREKKFKNFSSGNLGTINTFKEELNLVKLQEIELDKLKTQLDANLGNIGAERDIQKQILDIEREIFRLKTGEDITLKNLPAPKTFEDILKNMPEIQKPVREPSLNPLSNREKWIQERQEEEKIMQDVSRYANDMWSNFQGMLQATGLMKGQFGQIISFISSFIDSITSGVSFFQSLIGFIGSLFPGGSAVVGMASGGGGGLNIGGMPAGLPNISVPQRTEIPSFASGSLSSNVKYSVEMPDVKLKGSDIYLSWRRQKTIQDKRTQ